MNVLFNSNKIRKEAIVKNNKGCNYCGEESNEKINKNNLYSKPTTVLQNNVKHNFKKNSKIVYIFPTLK